MKEIWKDIPEYESCYQVSNLGRIKGLKRFVRHEKGGLKCVKEKIKKVCKNKDGYFCVMLYKNNKTKRYFVHRLVLIAFKGRSGLICNHRNCIKTDNRLENLEYCTQKENIEHAWKKGRMENIKNNWRNRKDKDKNNNHSKKKVNQFSLKGSLIATFSSLTKASKKTGASLNGISSCCNGKYKTCGRFKWKFV